MVYRTVGDVFCDPGTHRAAGHYLPCRLSRNSSAHPRIDSPLLPPGAAGVSRLSTGSPDTQKRSRVPEMRSARRNRYATSITTIIFRTNAVRSALHSANFPNATILMGTGSIPVSRVHGSRQPFAPQPSRLLSHPASTPHFRTPAKSYCPLGTTPCRRQTAVAHLSPH